nr:unnamed protein product [Callosobruchus chinensis]
MFQNRTRGVLLKLSRPSLKQAIYNKKKLLKGSGIVIKEDLTENRMKLLEAAIEKTSLKSDGRIMLKYVCVLKDNKKVFINDKDDLNKI